MNCQGRAKRNFLAFQAEVCAFNGEPTMRHTATARAKAQVILVGESLRPKMPWRPHHTHCTVRSPSPP